MAKDTTTRIPEPPGFPIIGNLQEINPAFPLGSLIHLADLYGPIYRLTIVGRSSVVIGTNKLLNEVCDEKRFEKVITPVLEQVRNGVKDGLFTSYGDVKEPNWGVAHRILMPAFGPLSIQGMFNEMHDIAMQLALKWARYGSAHPIQVTDDFTRLTLDTLALCAMDFRFNSFYHDEMHPFIQALGSYLKESGDRSRRLPLPGLFYKGTDQKYFADIDLIRNTSNEVLQSRKDNPNDRKDLLNAMLNGRDPKTGQGLSDDSIVNNTLTFLIAGHETTSGLLSFAFYQLIKHPEAFRKAQLEVDEVIGDGAIKVEHLSKLPYLNAVLRETLRVNATIPAIAVTAKQDDVIGGKYAVKKGEPVVCLLAKCHLDPLVYGEDASEFKPDRMLDENFEKLNKEFPNCWKPFGNGMRACIGRQFAWQEALLVLAILLQNFNFTFDDPSYQLSIKQNLTIKPLGFLMRASPRQGMSATAMEERLMSGSEPAKKKEAQRERKAGTEQPKSRGKPMAIYYGSNTGTCEALAQRLANDAPSHGYHATVVDAMDSVNQSLSHDHPIVLLTASYEGQPPDNAAHFVTWLESLNKESPTLNGVSYAVFGCGHHDWASTFHRIPKLVDQKMAEQGATRIAALGLADVARGDMFSDFDTWEADVFWPAMAEKYGASEATAEGAHPSIEVQVSAPRCSTLRQDVQEALVVATKTLTAPGVPEKKHIEIQLPSHVTYRSGDYMAVLPLNSTDIVHRAMRRFKLAWDSHLTITSPGPTLLPTGHSIPASDVFGAYVELSQPATKRDLQALVALAKDEETQKTLEKLAGDDFETEISAKRVSLLDLLEHFPLLALPMPNFLAMLPPMRVRQYSISSSPLWNPHHATLTFSILDAPSFSDPEGKRYHGVNSTYMASLQEGDKLHVAIKPSHASFHLPSDGEHTPVILVAAGTGLAPFRGFIQERAAQIATGRELADCVLWVGCREPEKDDIYHEDLAKWEAMGAVTVRRAFSRKAAASDGCKYVQDRLWADRDRVQELWQKGARVFVCGSREVGDAVRKIALQISILNRRKRGDTDEAEMEKGANEWFDTIRNERYSTDVFA